jgi:hypothetical protein
MFEVKTTTFYTGGMIIPEEDAMTTAAAVTQINELAIQLQINKSLLEKEKL